MLDLPTGYRDPRPIGKGGFAVVWRVWSDELGRDVALKLPIAAEDDRDLQRELALELHAAARLRHPNIVQVLDAGSTPSGLPFLAMELAEEGSFNSLIDSPRPWGELAGLLAGVLQGLGHAHARGVVHRDIKAANVLLKRTDGGALVPQVADFGLAKVLQEHGWYSTTRLGAGTLLYMPPEQFDSDVGAVHPAADLYAFGVLAWMAVCGRAPFDADGGFGPLLTAKLQLRLTPWVPRSEGAPAGLEPLLRSLVARQPEERPQLAADVLAQLRNLDADGGEPAAPRLPSSTGDSFLVDLEDSAFGPTPVGSGAGLGPHPPEPAAPPPYPSIAGIAGVREPRLVGREAERFALWTAARSAPRTPTSLVLRGPSGVGCSRLARWLSQTLEEAGIARTLHIKADQPDRVSDAMVRAVRRLLGLGRERGAPLRARLDRWVDPRPEELARLLAQWLTNRSTVPASTVLDRLLRVEADRGLVVVWMEDRGAGAALARQAVALLQQAQAAPFPLLLLYEPAAEGPAPEGSPELVVPPLSEEEVAALARDLLPDGIDPDAIVRAARGMPRVAVQAARLAAVVPTSDDPALAPTLSAPELAAARLQTLAANDAEGVGSLLMLLALLPRPVAPSVLRRAWELFGGGALAASALDGARRAGVVSEDAWGLDFGDPTFAAAALAEATAEIGNQARLACADALLEVEDGATTLSVAASRLLLDAHAPGLALTVAQEAAEALHHTDVAAARAAWANASDGVAQLGLARDEPRSVAVRLGAARAARAEGDVPAAVELLGELQGLPLTDAQAQEALSLRAGIAMVQGDFDAVLALIDGPDAPYDLLVVRAEALRRSGQLEESAAALEAALAGAEAAGDAHTGVACRWRLARLQRHLGAPDDARAGLDRALAAAVAIEDADVEVQVLRELGHLELAAGHMAEAEEALRHSLDRSAQAGTRSETAVTRLSLGELARSRGDLAAARRDYSAGLAVANAFGVTYLAITALLNLAIAELAMDKLAMAERRMRALDRIAQDSSLRPWIELVRAAVLGRAGRWDAVDEALGTLEGAAERLRGQEDFAKLLLDVGEGAAAADRPDVAGAAYAIALEVAELDGHERARNDLRRRLTALVAL